MIQENMLFFYRSLRCAVGRPRLLSNKMAHGDCKFFEALFFLCPPTPRLNFDILLNSTEAGTHSRKYPRRRPAIRRLPMIERMKELVRRKDICVLATVAENKPHCSLMAYVTDDECKEIYMAGGIHK